MSKKSRRFITVVKGPTASLYSEPNKKKSTSFFTTCLRYILILFSLLCLVFPVVAFVQMAEKILTTPILCVIHARPPKAL